MKYIAAHAGRRYVVELLDEHHLSVDGELLEVDFAPVAGQSIVSLRANGRVYEAQIHAGEEGWLVLLDGRLYRILVQDERAARLQAVLGDGSGQGGEVQLRAPMPGLVVSVAVDEGQSVEKGQVLIILESMKMQNELKAPRAGTVHRLRVRPGESVEQKQVLLSLA